MAKSLLLPLAAAAAAVFLTAAAEAPAPAAQRNCFLSRDWDGWTAPGDGDALVIRVGLKDYYWIGLTKGSHVRKRADEFLVNKVRGSSWICNPLDLDLQISDHMGFRAPLIATSIRKMTPEEVAALAPRDRP